MVRRHFSGGVVVWEALELLVHRQAKVLGLIFNRADASARSNHYYKYMSYHRSAKETRAHTMNGLGTADGATKGARTALSARKHLWDRNTRTRLTRLSALLKNPRGARGF